MYKVEFMSILGCNVIFDNDFVFSKGLTNITNLIDEIKTIMEKHNFSTANVFSNDISSAEAIVTIIKEN